MDIERLVSRILTEHQTRDPFEICSNLGIAVFRRPLLGVRGLMQIWDGVTVVQIAEDLSERAAAFVCAHELGHTLLHSGLNRVFLDSHTLFAPSKFENRADKFAFKLLYGIPPLMREEPLYDWQIADCLNISLSDVNRRLAELDVFY